MSTRAAKLRDIRERKQLLVAKANLQRSLFLMAADPIFRALRAAETGALVARIGQGMARRFRKRKS